MFRESDILTGVAADPIVERVTRVDVENDRVEFNQGRHITDLMGNALKRNTVVFDVPQQWVRLNSSSANDGPRPFSDPR